MGHKISKEQIDPGVKDHIMSFVGNVADLETEVNTDIISAVNSLMVDRVDNAENMGKLANAIGEPVTANHSIDEVVEGLGEMLSTFKTNMMNSGVVVESSDKFKQLIDKIKGLTEGEGGNSGIQFAMGEGNWTVSASNWGVPNEITIETNIGFIPSYIICKLSRVSVYFSNGSSSQGLNINNVFLSNLSPIDATIFDNYMSYGIPNSDIFIKNITENSFVLAETCTNVSGASSRMSGTLTEWYAIGVGEEDTTLRDSLASILEEEGVSVSEEDDMASLISKVDEEFENKDNEMSGVKQELVDALIAKGVEDITYDTNWEELIGFISKFKDFINIKFDGTQFLCGGSHAFLLKNDGTVWATGNNGYGQLGLGDTNNSTRFQQVNITDVKQIACGFNFTAILKNDGSVWTCGYNGYGQLGLGNTTNQSTFTKVTTNINNDVTQIYAGGYHLFALKNDGTVWCCGKNDYGQLGLGNTNSKSTFTKVTTNTEDTVKISCGYEHTYILKNNGMIFSCGKNSNGQLGLSTTNDMTTFNQVQNMDNVRNIISGGYHVFVVKKDGTLWACGYNGSGQLGLNDVESRATFVQVNVNVDDIQHVICGFNHSLIIRNDGILYAAGENGNGELGMNNTTDMRTFTNVPNLSSGIIAAYAGEFFTMIIDNEGIVYATGKNDSGQLGLSESTTRKSFTVINQL